MEMQLHKEVYLSNDFVEILTEVYENTVFLHVEVKRWNSSVLREAYNIFAKLEKDCREKGFDRMATFTPNPKFSRLFNGKTIEIVEINNKTIEVMVWELKHS